MDTRVDETIMQVPQVPDGETSTYRLLMGEGEENPVGSQKRVVSRLREGNNELFQLYSVTDYGDLGSLEETAIFEIIDILKPVSLNRCVIGKSGRVIRRSLETYDDRQWDGFKNPSMASSASTFSFRGGPFVPKSKVSFGVVTYPSGRCVKIYGEISQETVTVPAGKFECFRVDVTPDFESIMEQMMPPAFKPPPGIELFMKSMMPPTIRWFAQSLPHYLVKAEGGVISPAPFLKQDPIIEELVSIQ
ncbi:MAG: hypothetical protein SVY53_04965 [Chloroflexota bacterium]|nr:hypothetical protein [Chloroflexota bacterium]